MRVPLLIRNGIFLILFLVQIIGCKKKKEDVPLPWEDKGRNGVVQLISGNNQSGVFGEYLKDSIVFKVYGREESAHLYYFVKFRMRNSNGSVDLIDYPYSYATEFTAVNKDSYIRCKWELGCSDPVQKLDILLYVDSVNYPDPSRYDRPADDSVTITSSGIKPSKWGKACGWKSSTNLNPRIFSYNNTLYLIDRVIYRSEDGGVNWAALPGQVPNAEVTFAGFNSKGWLYIVTANQGVFYSENLISWKQINNGLLDYQYPTMLKVFDDELYVGFHFSGTYRSTDNGQVWQRMAVTSSWQQYNKFLDRDANGKIYIVDDSDELHASSDKGNTWQNVPIEYQYKHTDVQDFKIGPDGMLYIASGDATISAVSPDTYEGFSKSVYKWNGSTQYASDIQFVDNDVLYLIKWSDVSGIYSKNSSWQKLSLDFDERIDGYYKKPGGSFILQHDNRLYVRY